MPRPRALPDDERLLTMREAGERLHMDRGDASRLIQSEPTLAAGLRYRGRVSFILASHLVRYMNFAMSCVREKPAAVPPKRRAS